VYATPAAIRQHWDDQLPALREALLREILSSDEWRDNLACILESEGPTGDKLEIKRGEVAGAALEKGLDKWSSTSLVTGQCDDQIDTLVEFTGMEPAGNVGSPAAWEKRGLDKKVVTAAIGCFMRSDGAIRKLARRCAQLQPQELDGKCAALTCALVTETRAAIEAYGRAKREQGLLDFGDLLEGARDLWVQHPEVLQQVRRRVKHLMIDEFQDTNLLQKQVLWPLVTGAPWSPETEVVLPEAGPRLFVVGDAKQSIYRFLNADVTVFNTTRAQMDQAGARNDELTRNFRSTPELIAALNLLFSSEKVMGTDAAERWEASYAPMQADRGNCPAGQSPVEVHLLTEFTHYGPAESDEEEEGEGELGAGREREARWLARRLVRLLQSGETLIARRQGEDTVWDTAKPGDIAILFRAMSDVDLYEKALREVGLPYYLVVGRGFYNSQEVRDVVNALRALENRLDEVALVGALRSPLFGLSDETLYYLGQQGRGAWWDRLRRAAQGGPILEDDEEAPTWEDLLGGEQLQRVQRAVKILEELRLIKNRVSLGELIQELLDRSGLTAVLAREFGGERMVANVRKLVDLAGDYEEGPGPAGRMDLRSFIEYLKLMTTREVREAQAPVEEETGDSIKLITTHSAKGLQWPIVVVPDLCRRPGGNRGGAYRWHRDLGMAVRETRDQKEGDSGSYWPPATTALKEQNDAEDEAEERRLFYVAATRARDLLILSGVAHLKADGSVKAQDAKRPLGWINQAGAGALWSDDDNQEGESLWAWEGGELVAQPDCRTAEEPRGEGAFADTAASEPDWEAVRRHLRPVPASARGQKRFTATELSLYAHCPALPATAPKFTGGGGNDRLSALEMGNVVHQVLRLVGSEGRARLDEIVPAGARALHLDARLDHRAAQAAPEIRQRVQQFLDSSIYREVYATARRLRSEMGVTAGLEVEGETVVLEGVVDALVEGPDGNLHVLDYKTGDEDASKADQYRMQVGLYCYALHEATGRWPASAGLVYLGPSGLEIADLDVEHEARAAAEAARAAILGMWNGESPDATTAP
jgi:ATP-dependent helicase/nuclease subunit A